MKTQSITIDLPSDILLTLNETEAELKKNIKVSLAIQLYQKEKLSIGKAAQVAGLSKFNFEKLLSENKIPISNLDFIDIVNDSAKLK